MGIERADGRFKTALKTKNPLRVFAGERTWTQEADPYKPVWAKMTFPKDSTVIMRNEVFAKDPQTLEEQRFTIHNGQTFPQIPSTYHGQEINSPDLPWVGKVRYVDNSKQEPSIKQPSVASK